MEFKILGPLVVLDDAGQPIAIKGHRAAQILAFLLLRPNQPVSISRLIQALWPQPPPAARQSVHYFIHQLRKALGEGAGAGEGRLVTTAGGYQLRVAPEQLDAHRFDRLVGEARAARAASDLAGAAELFGQALGLWHGTALSEFAGEAFAQPFTAQLEEARLLALEDQLETGLELGQHARLVGELDALVQAHPQRERLHGLRMLALYRSGRQAGALDAYQFARKVLLESAGLEPGVELQRLQRGILAHDPALDPPAVEGQEHLAAELAATPSPPLEPAAAGPAARPAPAGESAPAVVAHSALRADPPVPRSRSEERRLITALVVGIGADLTVGGDPEEVRAQTGELLDGLAGRIQHYGGVVQTASMGRLLATFGTDRSHEDDPERAVRAALELVDPERSGPWGMRLHAGVATSEVVVVYHPDGPDEIIGEVDHVAAMLQQTAPPGCVLVSAATYQATARSVTYTPIQPTGGLLLGGGRRLWQAVAPRARTGAQVAEHPAAPLVERERELGLLAEAFRQFLRREQPQLVTLVSEPGLGKSRLVAELGRLVDASPELVGWRVGHARAYGQGVLGALADVVRAEVGILSNDPASAVQRKLQHALAQTGLDDDGEVAGALRALLGAADIEQLTSQREPLFDALARFLAAVADQRPLVMVVEDLQWADEHLVEFTARLAQRVADVPLLVVATARPELLERRPGWGGGLRNAITITLSPLSRPATRELLDALLAPARLRLPERTAEELVTASGGNPLYVEEYARMLTERPLIEQDAAEHTEDAEDAEDALPIPASVRQVIAARIDTLPPVDKQRLQDAAVIGETSWLGALTAVGQVAREDVQAGVRRLERQGFLRRMRTSTVAGETEYAFRHTLIRDVAYGQLLRADRAIRHQRAAGWIESLSADQGERVELLAHHYQAALELARVSGQANGRLTDRARTALRAAGDRALAVGALSVAAGRYQAALELWPDDDPDRPELLFRLARTLTYAEHRGRELLSEAGRAFAARGNDGRVAEVELTLSQLARGQGDIDAAQAHLDRSLAVAERAPLPVRASVLATAAWESSILERYEEAIRAGREVLALVDGKRLPAVEGIALIAVGLSRVHTGDHLTGVADCKRAFDLLDGAHDPRVGFLRWAMCVGLWYHGDLPLAAAELAEARRRVHAADAADTWLASLEALLAWADARWDHALALAEQILTRPAAPSRLPEPWAGPVRARIRLARADHTGAAEDAEATLEFGRRLREPRMEHTALALLGRIHLVAGRRDLAAARLEELLAVQRKAEAPTATPDQAELLLDLDRPAAELPALPPTAWHEAVLAHARGDLECAAQRYAAIGSRIDMATVRSRLARRLTAAGEPGRAGEQLPQAIPVWRLAGAHAWLAEAESLRAGLPARR